MDKFDRSINPVISTGQLNNMLQQDDLIIIDIRAESEFMSGHIPGAVNAPFTFWAVTKDGLDLELPDENELSGLIIKTGISKNAQVIIANKAGDSYSLANACRVADTLLYAGIKNAAVMDGGYEKWGRENRELSLKPSVKPVSDFIITADKSIFVTMDYVRSRIGKSIIIDARDPAVYFGLLKETNASSPGHIPGAKSLPAPWIWTVEGTYRSKEQLSEMAAGIIGKDSNLEIIVYCGVGGYTSAWWFVLTQILDYNNVKFYDGSAQDWTNHTKNSVVSYKWE
jgi:thiosulfate/3-mercaptopyruvate sulfurtransferase